MISNAFIIGFFTALGWFSAQKLVTTVDPSAKPIVQTEQQK